VARVLTMARRRFAVMLAVLAVATFGGFAGKAVIQPAAVLTNSCDDNHGYHGSQEDTQELAAEKQEDQREASQHLTAKQDQAEDKQEQKQQRAEDQREKDCDHHDADNGDQDNEHGDDGGSQG
jgi:flagellar motility protein MotE (MotC chaperone)